MKRQNYANYIPELLGVATRSKDQSTQTSALIIDTDGVVRASGVNGQPRGCNDEDCARQSREGGEKYFWFEHAERNAIYNSARVGVPLRDTTLMCTHFPCTACTRAIIQSGIIRVVTTKPEAWNGGPHYTAEFERSLTMLAEANVEVLYFELPKNPYNERISVIWPSRWKLCAKRILSMCISLLVTLQKKL